jgi:predicted nucleotidyltransferase component of viral defense system
MKEQALVLVRGIDDPGLAVNRLREYLQCLVLRTLHESEAFTSMAFVGGTALRFLHDLPRFSEDLDFSLLSAGNCMGREWMTRVKRDLAFAGFQVDVTWNERHVVNVGWVRVAGILHEADLAATPAEKLSIKVEIDTNPPNGARIEKRVVTRYVTFLLPYHDLPSLMAGKIAAVLTRKYAKGRDWYDLAWYLSRRPPVAPNLDLLGSALEQAQGRGRSEAADWPSLVRKRLEALDVDAIARDVRPFLERPEEASLLTRDNFVGLLQRS